MLSLPPLLQAVDLSSVVPYLVLLWLTFMIRRAYFTPMSKIPGPFLLKFSNLPLRYYIVTGRFHTFSSKMHTKYGEVVRIGHNQVSLTNTVDIRRILSTHEFLKGPAYNATVFLAPTTFSTTDPEANKMKRRQLGNTYSFPNMRIWEDSILKHGVLSLMANWDRNIDKSVDGKSAIVNYYYDFHALAFDIIGILTFGKSFNMLTEGDTTMVDYVHKMFILSGIQGNFPFVKRVQWLVKPLAAARKVMVNYAENSIAQRKNDIAQGKVFDLHADILQRLMHARDPHTGQSMEGKSLVSEMVMMLVAGTDTTSNTLTWTLMNLLHYPETYKRLCQEIRSEFPDTSTPIRYDQAKSRLPYLTAVFLESMRHIPAASGFLPRLVPSTGTTLNGYFIPGSSEICISIAASHRNPKLWPNPNMFDPERFMGDAELVESRIRDILPFSTGVRVCVGRNLAWVEMYTVLANILRNYDVSLPEDSIYGPDRLVNGLPEQIPSTTFTTCSPTYPSRDCRIRITKVAKD